MKLLFIPILVFVLLSFTHSFGVWRNINQIQFLSSIETMYENNQYLPSQSILLNPKVNVCNVTEEEQIQSQWYMIGRNINFPFHLPKKVTIWGKKYVLWKKNENKYVCRSDTGPHVDVSLSQGTMYKKCMISPEYQRDFNPQYAYVEGTRLYAPPQFQVIEKNKLVYMNTLGTAPNATDTSEIICNTGRYVYIESCIDIPPPILMDASLDIVHIIFAKLFTMKDGFEPSDIRIVYSPNSSYNVVDYTYTCEPDSAVCRFFETNEMIISSNIVRPYVTTSCVTIGDKQLVFETNILPIDANHCKIYICCYQNIGLYYRHQKWIGKIIQTFLDVYTQLSICSR